MKSHIFICLQFHYANVETFVRKLQILDPAVIEKMVEKVLVENPKQLEQYRGGKTKLQGFFAGQVFSASCIILFPFI